MVKNSQKVDKWLINGGRLCGYPPPFEHRAKLNKKI